MPLRKAYAYTSKMMTVNMMAMDAKEGISAFLRKKKTTMEKQVIDDKIKELFISARVIALVGASNNKEKDFK